VSAPHPRSTPSEGSGVRELVLTDRPTEGREGREVLVLLRKKGREKTFWRELRSRRRREFVLSEGRDWILGTEGRRELRSMNDRVFV